MYEEIPGNIRSAEVNRSSGSPSFVGEPSQEVTGGVATKGFDKGLRGLEEIGFPKPAAAQYITD